MRTTWVALRIFLTLAAYDHSELWELRRICLIIWTMISLMNVFVYGAMFSYFCFLWPMLDWRSQSNLMPKESLSNSNDLSLARTEINMQPRSLSEVKNEGQGTGAGVGWGQSGHWGQLLGSYMQRLPWISNPFSLNGQVVNAQLKYGIHKRLLTQG